MKTRMLTTFDSSMYSRDALCLKIPDGSSKFRCVVGVCHPNFVVLRIELERIFIVLFDTLCVAWVDVPKLAEDILNNKCETFVLQTVISQAPRDHMIDRDMALVPLPVSVDDLPFLRTWGESIIAFWHTLQYGFSGSTL